MSIVVAYGATEESRAALVHGIAEAVRRKRELHVLVTGSGAEGAAKARLESEAGDLPGWTLHEVPPHQNPAHAVLDLASNMQAEVIVVGTRRRSPVGKLLLGSLAQEILLGADVPVLLVKP